MISQANSVRVTSGSLEAIKWFALACMVVDHVNAVFFARQLPEWAAIVGRVSFPLFALVFAFNLARPGGDRWRVAHRLVIAGALAQPFFAFCFGTVYGVWPLNIMFLFAFVVGIVGLLEVDKTLPAFALGIVGGLLVEYGFPGVLLCVVAWAHFRRPSVDTVIALVASLGWLCLYNGNAYALLALPLFGLGLWLPLSLGRSRWAFYAFYPAHLALLVLLAGVGAAHG